MDNSITSVYRYYDGRGALLYVGITSRGMKRNQEHNHSQDWWRFTATQTIEHYERREDAERRERELIREFRPPFNTAHNPDHLAFRMAYLLSYSDRPNKDRFPLHDLERTGAWREIPLEITAQSKGFLMLTSPPEYIEAMARIVWEQSESRLVMNGSNVGALRHTHFNDFSITWHYELAEEITKVHTAWLDLNRSASGRTFRISYTGITADQDQELVELNRVLGDTMARRYPLRKARKSPKPAKMKRKPA